MMTTDNSGNDGSLPEDHVAAQADTGLRELLSSLPVSKLEADFEHRLLAKIHRRKITIRATCAASLIALLAVCWHLRTGVRDQLQQPERVAQDQPRGDSTHPNGKPVDEVELFATAFQDLSPPVVQFETIEHDLQALSNVLGSPNVLMEKQ